MFINADILCAHLFSDLRATDHQHQHHRAASEEATLSSRRIRFWFKHQHEADESGILVCAPSLTAVPTHAELKPMDSGILYE